MELKNKQKPHLHPCLTRCPIVHRKYQCFYFFQQINKITYSSLCFRNNYFCRFRHLSQIVSKHFTWQLKKRKIFFQTKLYTYLVLKKHGLANMQDHVSRQNAYTMLTQPASLAYIKTHKKKKTNHRKYQQDQEVTRVAYQINYTFFSVYI